MQIIEVTNTNSKETSEFEDMKREINTENGTIYEIGWKSNVGDKICSMKCWGVSEDLLKQKQKF